MTSNVLPSSSNRPGTVLLVEDNHDDVFFMREASKAADIPHSLTIVNDGQTAVDYLAGVNGYHDRERHPLPDLIVLDLNLPRRTGHEVLEWLRSQPALRTVPVVMLTTSTHKADIERAYQLGVSSYLVKKFSYVQFREVVRIIFTYWLHLNVRPE
jgi:CheY-like chemotaxis protein